MNKRDARYHALEFAIGILEADVEMSNELYAEWGENGDKVHDALLDVIDLLRDKLERATPPAAP